MELDSQIKELDTLILQMAGQVEKNLFYALDVYLNYSSIKQYPPVDDYIVNNYERLIEEKALNIMLKERLYAKDMRMVTGIMTMVEDLERLGDHAQDVLEFSLKLKNNSSAHSAQIKNLTDFVIKMVKDSIQSYISRDIDLAKKVTGEDDHVDEEYARLIDFLIKENERDEVSSSFAIYTTLVVKYIERIADHATNIAEWVIYIVSGYYKDRQIV